MDSLVSKLQRRGKLVCLAASQVLIIGCCVMLAWGTWRQHEVNATNMAPVTGLSMIWVFGVGYLTAVAIGLQSLTKLVRIASGRITRPSWSPLVESEEHLPHCPADPWSTVMTALVFTLSLLGAMVLARRSPLHCWSAVRR